MGYDEKKTRNNMTDHISMVYIKNDTKLFGPIELGMVGDETRQDNDVIDHIGGIYFKNKIELS